MFQIDLHNLHGPWRFHFLLFNLNDSKDLRFFIVPGTIDQILGAIYDIISVPHFTKLTLLLRHTL